MKKHTYTLAFLLAALLAMTAGRALAATNAEMEAAITAALVDKLGSDAQTIKVAFFEGKATLSGHVTEDSTQELSEQVALYVPGVRKVENEVDSAKNRGLGEGKLRAESNDAALESNVKKALHNEIGDHSKPLEVEACAGVVSIRGPVPDQARHDLAVAAAKKVNDVVKVIDLLRNAS